MKNLYSLFLSQAYRDCWDDYNRSLKLKNFPKWDYVILTASNEQQAEGFRKQIEDRKAFLPKETTFVAIPDRDGKRVGSGGATLEVLKYLHGQEESFDGLRILVIQVETVSVYRSILHWASFFHQFRMHCRMDVILLCLMNL